MGTCRANSAPVALQDCCNVLTSRLHAIYRATFHLPKRTLERRAPIAWGDALRESEFTRWVYQGCVVWRRSRKMRFDTVIMGGASPDYSVACNCKNTACAVPLHSWSKRAPFLIWIAGFAEPSPDGQPVTDIHSGLESLRQQDLPILTLF